MPGQRLRPVPTLAEIFHSAGWSTAAFSLSPGISNACGLDRGFTLFDDSLCQTGDDRELTRREGSAELVANAVDWIRDRDSFFLFVSLFGGYGREGEVVSLQARKAELETVDSQIGRLLNHMASWSPRDKTVIVIFSGRGYFADENGRSGGPGSLGDAVLRIPLIVSLPGLADGGVVGEQVRGVDIFPTLLDYFGLPPFLPAGAICDGRSLVPLISGFETGDVPSSFSESYVKSGRTGDSTAPGRHFAIRTENVKLVYSKTHCKWSAYDLQEDPGETKDVFDDYDPRFCELREKLQEYIRQGEEFERVRMASEKQEPVRRSLEALGYVEESVPQSTTGVSFPGALHEGKQLLDRGKYREAAGRLSELLSIKGLKETLRMDARMCLAEALRRMKRTDEAIEQLRQILDESVDSRLSARATLLMATVEAEERSIEGGISVIGRFLETARSPAPEDEIRLRAKRAALYREIQQYERAIVDYKLILEKSPQNIDACYSLGSLFKQIGNYARAQACFEQVLRISTSHPDKYHGGAHYHLADISLKRSLRAHAEESLRQCLRINPQHGAARRELDRVSSSAR
jgi:tetratricopeptide (TPR) repeat protein